MTYKHKIIYSFIYMFAFLLELTLIAVAYFATRYYFIFIPIVSVIFVLNVLFYIKQLMTSYELRKDGIYKHFKEKSECYLYDDFISVRNTFLYLEITYKTDKKIRTLYISKLLKKYSDFDTEFNSYIMYRKKEIMFF